MKEAFAEIIERFQDEKKGWLNFLMTDERYVNAKIETYNKAIEIVKEVAEECKDKYVSIGAYKQVAWERDIAIEQLHELGYEFGEKIEDRWIYCSSGKFPEEDNKHVIVSAVWDGYEYTTDAYFYKRRFYVKPYYQIKAGEILDCYVGDFVIAWRDFPKPCKRKEDDDECK